MGESNNGTNIFNGKYWRVGAQAKVFWRKNFEPRAIPSKGTKLKVLWSAGATAPSWGRPKSQQRFMGGSKAELFMSRRPHRRSRRGRDILRSKIIVTDSSPRILIAKVNFVYYKVDMDVEDLLGKALKIVENSQLSDKRKALISERLPLADPLILELFIRICDNNQDAIETVLDSLEEKENAAGDLEKMRKIVGRERKEVEEALKK